MTVPNLLQHTFFRGRVAMAALLRSLGVARGDRVAIQAFTCLAVPEAVMAVGAVPVYVDVAPGEFTMSAESLAAALKTGLKAVVIQHTFGMPADMTRLGALCRTAGVPFIEDCSHTIASRWDGKLVGTMGAGGFYSFEASKPVFAGIGGSAVTTDDTIAQRLRDSYAGYRAPGMAQQLQIRAMTLAHAIAYRPATYWTVRAIFRKMVALGVIKGNYNKVEADAEAAPPAEDFTLAMGGMQQALLKRRLSSLEPQTAHRRFVAQQLRSRVPEGRIRHPRIAPEADPVFGRYPMLTDDRPGLLEEAVRARVELADFYNTAVHPFKGTELRQVGYEPGSCSEAERVSRQVISLPTNMHMRGATLERAIRLLGGQ